MREGKKLPKVVFFTSLLAIQAEAGRESTAPLTNINFDVSTKGGLHRSWMEGRRGRLTGG